jgi:hypothetical protein
VIKRSEAGSRGCRVCLWVGTLVMVLSMLSLLPYLGSSTEVVRMRNALLVVDGPASDFDWSPATRPTGFDLDSAPPDPKFVDVARRLQLDTLPDDWARAVAISQHLLTGSETLAGGPIQSDLNTTYRRIVEYGDGYCADFVRVFNALAGAAGIPVRSWAFSFDGFGGRGHVFPEIWNRQLQRWQLVDVYNNYAIVGADGRPLSALEFRRALLEGTANVRLLALAASARPGFIHEEKAWEYYLKGAPEWYLWWGEQAFAYDRAWAVRTFDGHSRSLAQMGAIVQGVHPRIRILSTSQNAPQVAAMHRLKVHLLAVTGLAAAAAASMATCEAVMLVRRRRRIAERGQVAAEP